VFGTLANTLSQAAQTAITLVNNSVTVNLTQLAAHVPALAVLRHRDADFHIFAVRRERGTVAVAFQQLLLQGGESHYLRRENVQANRRKGLLSCELLGRTNDGKFGAFLSSGAFWTMSLSGINDTNRSIAHDYVEIPSELSLPLPSSLAADQALLGVRLAFLEGMEAGLFGFKRAMVLGALRKQGHEAFSPEAQEALEKFFLS
jgi:hypothetical protein